MSKLVPADSADQNRFERVRQTPENAAPTERIDHEPAGPAVSGRVFVAIPDAVTEMSGSFERFTRNLLSDAGLQGVRADDWYPQETLVTLLEHLQERVGDQIIERLGRFLPELLSWPETVIGLTDALHAVGDWYGTWNRDDESAISVTELDAGQQSLSIATPYPAQFERGLVRGLIHEFGSNATRVRTTVYDAEPDREAVYRLTFGARAPPQAAGGSPLFEDGERLQH